MADQRAFKQVAENAALKHVLMHVARVAYVGAGYDLAAIKATHREMLEILRGDSFSGTDPATSDHLTAEIADAVETLLTGIEDGLKEGPA